MQEVLIVQKDFWGFFTNYKLSSDMGKKLLESSFLLGHGGILPDSTHLSNYIIK